MIIIRKILIYQKYIQFRVKKKTLLSISYYHHILDDFSYCNLLLLKKGKKSQLQ